MGRRRTCECGECPKCKHRDYMRLWYSRPANAEKQRASVKLYRERNIEQVRLLDRLRNRTPERLAAKRERERGKPPTEGQRTWKRRNPEKVRAHALLAYHVRVGNVAREACEVCGDAKTHGHHDDYSKPLDVRWLCHTHHMELHRMYA